MVVKSDVISRTFRVRCGAQSGTCFTVDHQQRQYLVSARHVLEEVEQLGGVELFHGGQWKPLPVQLVGHGAGDIDITVCAPSVMLTSAELDTEPSSAGLNYGQQTFFLGFPFGLFGDFPELLSGYPIPFVKGAIVSMLGFGQKPMFLDGFNNAGFSGGPVAWQSPDDGDDGRWRIAGVISGYTSTSDKVLFNGQDLGHRYQANSGLIRAFSIRAATELMENNPIGFAHPAAL